MSRLIGLLMRKPPFLGMYTLLVVKNADPSCSFHPVCPQYPHCSNSDCSRDKQPAKSEQFHVFFGTLAR